MIYPNRPLAMLALLPLVACLALLVRPDAWPAILFVDALVVGLAAADIFSVPGRKRFRARRECDTILSLGEPHHVTLWVENRARRPVTLEIKDDRLAEFTARPDRATVTAPARSRVRINYTLIPRRRGSFVLQRVYLRTVSRMSLWQRIYRLEVETPLRVYPDLKQISRYAMYARLNRLSLMGVRRTRRIGTDNEFERLREYAPGDNYKNIDWRATARRRKPIVRDYQANRSQRIVFMIDCGRMMVNEAGGLTMLDHALDAMLMLSHVALTRGDQAGLLTFSDRVHHWIGVGGGPRRVNRFVHAVHDLFPRLVESRYDAAFLHLERHCRKRTLVVLITNVIDEVNANQVEARLTNLVGRHLPLAVLLRDREAFEALGPAELLDSIGAEPTPAQAARLYRAAAAADLLDWREQVLGSLRRRGALTLDLFPDRLTAPLINEYLRIKAQHLL